MAIYWIIVGIEEYQNSDKIDKLSYAESDAELMAKTASEFKDCAGPWVLLGSRDQPKAKDFEKALGKVGAKLGGGDVVVVYFAGHGTQPEEGEPHLLFWEADPESFEEHNPLGSDHYPWSRLISHADIFRSQGANVILMLDCCRSATLRLRRVSGRRGMSRGWQQILTERNIGVKSPLTAKESRSGTIAALFSCGADQFSYECPHRKHGLFTYFAAEALSEKGIESGEEVIFSSVAGYVADSVSKAAREYGVEQSPHVRYIPEEAPAGLVIGRLKRVREVSTVYRCPFCPSIGGRRCRETPSAIILATSKGVLSVDTTTYEVRRMFKAEGSVRSVEIAEIGAEGRVVCAGTRREVIIGEVDRHRPLRRYPIPQVMVSDHGINSIAVLGEELFASKTDAGVLRWELSKEETEGELVVKGQARDIQQGEDNILWFTLNGRIAKMEREGKVRTVRSAVPQGTEVILLSVSDKYVFYGARQRKGNWMIGGYEVQSGQNVGPEQNLTKLYAVEATCRNERPSLLVSRRGIHGVEFLELFDTARSWILYGCPVDIYWATGWHNIVAGVDVVSSRLYFWYLPSRESTRNLGVGAQCYAISVLT